jgi:hypothetical protein
MSVHVGELVPELSVSDWLNARQPIRLAELRGRVVVLEAFQMLCPGCAQAGLPQLMRVHEEFASAGVAVLGLHTVFEHHAVQGGRAPLEVFLSEYRYRFPVGIDRPNGTGLPETMAAYGLEGTPSLLLIDAGGRLRQRVFGHIGDMRLGAEIMALVAEARAAGQ